MKKILLSKILRSSLIGAAWTLAILTPGSIVSASSIINVTGGEFFPNNELGWLSSSIANSSTYTFTGSTITPGVTNFDQWGGTFNPNTGYIDFGTGFSSVNIKSTWVSNRPFTPDYTTTSLILSGAYWSDSAVGTNNLGNASTFNFGYIGTIPNSGGTGLWRQSVDFGPGGLTPLGQFLIVSTATGSNATGGANWNEFAIVGDVVPEPSTWALLGAGVTGLIVLRRRQKSVA